MEHILIVRETIVKFFKRFEVFIMPLLKFALGYFVFASVGSIGHIHESILPFTELLNPTMLNILFALLFTVMPMNLGWLLIILSITAQVSANIEVAVAVFLFMLFIFIFYVRMAPKESLLILFTIIAFHFNVPYLIPLIVGLYLPVTSIIPITVGIFINAQIPVLFGLLAPGQLANIADMEIADLLTEIPEAFSVVYETLMRTVTGTQDWVFVAVIFAMVIVLVHFVSRLAIDYSKEIAIALGCVMNIFGLIVTVMVVDANVEIGRMIGATLLCGLLAGAVRCFDSILAYQRAESVQFEDDNNYYHVRMVPKVMLSKPKRVVKRIRPETGDLPNLDTSRPERPKRPDTPRREPVRPVRQETTRREAMPRPEAPAVPEVSRQLESELVRREPSRPVRQDAARFEPPPRPQPRPETERPPRRPDVKE